jgi:hypothetical protein
LVRGVVARWAPATADGPQQRRLALLHTLRLPPRWLRLAQAHRAKYQVPSF